MDRENRYYCTDFLKNVDDYYLGKCFDFQLKNELKYNYVLPIARCVQSDASQTHRSRLSTVLSGFLM